MSAEVAAAVFEAGPDPCCPAALGARGVGRICNRGKLKLGIKNLQGYSYDQRLEYVDMDFNVPHKPIVGLGQ